MRLLVVEDDARLASVLEKGLREAAYAVDVVGTGKAAIVEASVVPYDAIVLDVNIPEPNGFEVARRLRSKGNTALILMLTARDAVNDRIAGLDAGADDYLTKPFAFAELLARLRALLRRGTEGRLPQLQVADLVLEPATRTVRRGGEPIALTNREFALLEYLMRNAGRVVSKTMIMEHVWNYNFDPRTNVVDVLVFRLRERVDKDFATKLIHTVRGIGYVLRVE